MFAQVLRVGYRANSAGWLGSFHPDASMEDGTRGLGPADRRWEGPVVEVVAEVAAAAGFTILVTDLEADVAEVARNATGSTSTFTQCAQALQLECN